MARNGKTWGLEVMRASLGKGRGLQVPSHACRKAAGFLFLKIGDALILPKEKHSYEKRAQCWEKG